jgi:hypothetical protein
MFDRSDAHQDAAMRGIADTRRLLEQQQYELQRRMADLELRLQELETYTPTRTLPGDVAGQIEALPVSLRRALSRAREELDEAEWVLNQLLNAVLLLDLRHDS